MHGNSLNNPACLQDARGILVSIHWQRSQSCWRRARTQSRPRPPNRRNQSLPHSCIPTIEKRV
jgi:hypothetical protein